MSKLRLSFRPICLPLLLLAFNGLIAFGQDPKVLSTPSMPALSQGETLKIGGESLIGETAKIVLSTGDPKATGRELEGQMTADGKWISAVIPRDVGPGRYLVSLQIKDKAALSVPGHLEVRSAEVKILGAEPLIAYEDKGVYDITLSGQNFSGVATDNRIEMQDRHPSALSLCNQDENEAKVGPPCLEGVEVPSGSEGSQLNLRLRPGEGGVVQLRVRVGDSVSLPKKVTLAKISGSYIKLWSALTVLLLMAALLWLFWKSIGPRGPSGRKRNPLAAFLLDEQTSSYSLSRFQLLVWTTVIVFGYVYLYLSKQLVQAVPGLPPIPDGLPALLGLSVGTAVLAVGATLARGSKGAGPIEPGPADLISVGGVIAPERVQFLIWTLVAAAGFLGIVLDSEPTTISVLPEVPASMLYLMGVSSAGYLGGKIMRNPGPVIRTVEANPAGWKAAKVEDLLLRIQGDNLDKNATFRIDDKPLEKWQYDVASPISQDPATAASGLCKQLDLIVHEAEMYKVPMEGNKPHQLSITNSDGQSAAAPFPSDMMIISTATIIDGGKSIEVKGKNFAKDTSAEWIVDGKEPLSIATGTDGVKFQEPTKLAVKLPQPVSSGTKGILRLSSPVGLKAEVTVSTSTN